MRRKRNRVTLFPTGTRVVGHFVTRGKRVIDHVLQKGRRDALLVVLSDQLLLLAVNFIRSVGLPAPTDRHVVEMLP